MQDKVFAYCERGSDPGLLAEPLNAVTNLAFILAGLVVLNTWRRLPAAHRQGMVAVFGLLLLAIGTGSGLFHTVATGWASIADVAPIGAFMLCYWAYAVRRFLGAGWPATVLATAGFAATLWAAGQITCPAGGGLAWGGEGVCLNGSLGFVPALLAMPLIGGLAALRRHPVAPALFLAAGIFTLSLSLRSLDRALCDVLTFGGTPVGSHFLWHLLNAATLYLLVRAAQQHGIRSNG